MSCSDSTTDSMDINMNKLGNSRVQGNLVCCSPRGHKELDLIY